MVRTKIVKSTGRFGPRYGDRVKKVTLQVENRQNKKQKCPYCKKLGVKRLSKGLWKCDKCSKKFTLGAYSINEK